jgi:branched-chain amino acid transport system ATP-binding protein
VNAVVDQPPAIAARGVDLVIDGHRILCDITLDVPAGEFLAIIGPNGAGKTSLINVLSGAFTPTSGAVDLNGVQITGWAPHQRARAGMGRTFQTSNLLMGRSVLENVRLAANAQTASLRSGFGRVSVRDAATRRALHHLDLVGLADRAHDLAGSLSHGDRRKLELAMVLAMGSSVILLDEPMAGVNSDDVEALVELIRSVHELENTTILMVEHHMQVVMDLAQRIAVMHHGALLAIGPPDEIIANETVQSAYVGEPL